MKRFNWQIFFSLVTLVAIAGVAYFGFSGLGNVMDSNRSDQLQIVEKAIKRATVQCYALEGAYPPNLEYLEKNYGISIDESRYFVHFQTNDISNAMPDIQVFEPDYDPDTTGFLPDTMPSDSNADSPLDTH